MSKGRDYRIVVLNRGWVAVGAYKQDGVRCTLDDAAFIRQWGTSSGLGELVPGPTERTVLDPVKHGGTLRFNDLCVVFTIDCAEDGEWDDVLRNRLQR